MEDSLDECIEEPLRKLDQMCFSSQYYMMMCLQMNGVIYVVFAIEIWLKTFYSPFTDTAFCFLAGALIMCYYLLSNGISFIAIQFKIWKIKHEDTSWHILNEQEDELDIPGWEDLQGTHTHTHSFFFSLYVYIYYILIISK